MPIISGFLLMFAIGAAGYYVHDFWLCAFTITVIIGVWLVLIFPWSELYDVQDYSAVDKQENDRF